MTEFAVCQNCYSRTLEPKLSEDGSKTLCPECKKAEIADINRKESTSLRADNARLEAENGQMRVTLEWLEVRLEDYLREEWLNPTVAEMKNRVTNILESTSALSPSTDESEKEKE